MTVPPSDASLPFRDPAWVVDAEMRVISCSDAAEGALGMARRDLTALGELAGEVAHEFGNILQAIGLHVAALRRQPGLPEAVGRSLGAIKQAVDTGHGYTRRLVTFARDDGGRMERLDIAPVLRDVVQLLESRILHEGRPVRLQVSIDPLPEVAGNRSQLSAALLNVPRT